jgi:hypothetical protein
MSGHEEKRPILILRSDEGRQQWELNRDEIILGRDDTCDIVLPDRQISRQHARIYRESDAYFIEDLGSSNGTWVNNNQVKTPHQLHNDDNIRIAAMNLRFLGSEATAPMLDPVPANLAEGKLRLDREARRVFVGEREIDPPLSVPQYRLLELLFVNSGRVCTREQVVETVWPEAFGEGVSEQAIDALVRRLRDRIAEVDPDWQYIITVRGHGFRLEQQ